jgi:hypothetical protein
MTRMHHWRRPGGAANSQRLSGAARGLSLAADQHPVACGDCASSSARSSLWDCYRYFKYDRIYRYYVEPTWTFPYFGLDFIRPLPEPYIYWPGRSWASSPSS